MVCIRKCIMVCISICSKYDNTTNTAAFLIMHCFLFAANELNNAPNSSCRVGGEVGFFPKATTGDVRLAACFPTTRWSCLPRPHRCSNTRRPVTIDACCSIAVVNVHKPPAPGHHVQRCKSNQPCHVHVYMQTTKQDHRHFFCKSASAYKLNTR